MQRRNLEKMKRNSKRRTILIEMNEKRKIKENWSDAQKRFCVAQISKKLSKESKMKNLDTTVESRFVLFSFLIFLCF